MEKLMFCNKCNPEKLWGCYDDKGNLTFCRSCNKLKMVCAVERIIDNPDKEYDDCSMHYDP